MLKYKFSFLYLKMSKEVKAFGNLEIKNPKFYRCKNLILLEDIDIYNMLPNHQKTFRECSGHPGNI